MKILRLVLVLVFSAALLVPVAFAQNTGTVENATFTTNVANGAPVDFRQQFLNSTPVVYYYGELLGLSGQTVTFVWSLEGKRMQKTTVKVTKPRQPAWSKINMQEQWMGNWSVKVLDGKGRAIDQQDFSFNPPL